jgi:hypothetical protein
VNFILLTMKKDLIASVHFVSSNANKITTMLGMFLSCSCIGTACNAVIFVVATGIIMFCSLGWWYGLVLISSLFEVYVAKLQ